MSRHWPRICLGRWTCWSQPRWKSWMKRTPALGQPAGQQAVGGVGPRLADLGAVELEDRFRLAREVGQLGHRGLHPVGQLVLGDPREDLGIADLAVLELVQPAPGRRASAAAPRRRGPAGLDRKRTGSPDGAELDALVLGRQEPAAPEPIVERLVVRVAGPLRDQHHEGRQVLVLAPQAVGQPRPDARPAGELGAGLEEGDGQWNHFFCVCTDAQSRPIATVTSRESAKIATAPDMFA